MHRLFDGDVQWGAGAPGRMVEVCVCVGNIQYGCLSIEGAAH